MKAKNNLTIHPAKQYGGVILSPSCSLSCVFCGGHKKTSDVELRKQEILAYKNLQYFKQQGLKKIAISGSDPIEYKKIAELIQYIKQEGFEFVQLSTHGTRLVGPSFFKKLTSSGIDIFRMPIYGSNPKTHDAVTRTPGSFTKLVTGIKNLIRKKPNIKIQLSCSIVEQNKRDLLNIFDFVNDKLGIKNFYFSIPCLQEKDSSFYVPFKDLSSYAKPLYNYALKANNEIKFLEIPFCIFGKLNLTNIDNKCVPPNLGKYNQPPEPVKTSIPDLPSYRLKRKPKMCLGCQAFDYCDGFFINDIDHFGTGKIRPIK